MEPVVLFAPIGPYTDPITQLIWALHQKRHMLVVEAHVVVDKRALRYLETELLAGGQILDELRTELGPSVLPREAFVVHRAERPDGELVEDDANTEEAQIYMDAAWRGARAAIESAGDRRVIFGLLAGRRRSLSAFQSAFYQTLSRKQDLLVDVRVSDGRVAQTGDFFFPGQRDHIQVGSAEIDPRRVDVELVELKVPRFGGLLDPRTLDSYDAAREAGQAAINAAMPPRLVLELERGRCRVDGLEVPLSKAELVWYAYLITQRGRSAEGWVIVGQDGHLGFAEFLVALGERSWLTKIRTDPLRRLMSGDYVDDEDLRNLRGKTVQKLKAWCAAEHPGWARHIVPESDGGRHQRLPLHPRHIEIG